MALTKSIVKLSRKSTPSVDSIHSIFRKQRSVVVTGSMGVLVGARHGKPVRTTEVTRWRVLPYSLEKDRDILRIKATVISYEGDYVYRPDGFRWAEGERDDTVTLELKSGSGKLIYLEEFNL